ncbi:MAG TPA: heme o synthase [Phycisphaerae bacterium]|nr:protoheme IX farnesyltransferase [Phycisphaerales bacterium]HRX84441.1 heme o synthase [Phycisphaerae bacterium]
MTALAQAIRSATLNWRALVELAKPRLSALVLFTALVGYAAGASGSIDVACMIHVLLGTALVAAGANAFNQVIERDLDGLMERTKTRPLPTQRVSTAEATRFAVLVSAAGLLELLFGVNLLTAFLGAVALTAYVLLYTPLKRITVHNTLVGALVGALPPLMGWTAARGALEPGGWALAAILFVWQLPHFFAISWIYRADYRRGGYRMLGAVDESGALTRLQVAILALLLIPVSLMPTVVGVAGRTYFHVALVLGVAYWLTCLWPPRFNQDTCARRSFIASIIYLPTLLAFLLIDKL